MTSERKKKATNKQKAETKYKCSQIKSFSSRLAKPETAPQIELRLPMYFVENFRLRLTIKLDTYLILNITQHSCTISTDCWTISSAVVY